LFQKFQAPSLPDQNPSALRSDRPANNREVR
jgi:hypothetical protein